MQRLSDSVTSIFQVDTEGGRLPCCLQGGSTTVYSEKFGLGWRFGLLFANDWPFAKVKVFFDHTHCSTETDTAEVTVCLKDGSALEDPSFDRRSASITDFGHGPPALLGSFSPSHIIAHSYMIFTVTTKAKFSPPIADPLAITASALRQSMYDGSFVNTKYYVVSKRRSLQSARETRCLYANSAVSTQLAPVPSSYNKGNHLLVQYNSESRLIKDADVYNYDLDSDLDPNEEEENENENDRGLPSSPPPYHYSSFATEFNYDVSNTASSMSALSLEADDQDDLSSTDTFVGELSHQMVLVRDTAFVTWASYIYYVYTGQVSFYPLKSKGLRGRHDPTSRFNCSVCPSV